MQDYKTSEPKWSGKVKNSYLLAMIDVPSLIRQQKPIQIHFKMQWLSGRVLDQIKDLQVRASLASLPCVLEPDTLILAEFYFNPERHSQHNWKIVDGDVMNQIKQTLISQTPLLYWYHYSAKIIIPILFSFTEHTNVKCSVTSEDRDRRFHWWGKPILL